MRRSLQARWAAGALAVGLVVSACGLDDGAVDALDQLPGVESVSSFCELTLCSVDVDLEPGITARELRDVIERTADIRGVDSSQVNLPLSGDATLQITRDGKVGTDPGRAADAAVRLRAFGGLQSATLALSDRASALQVTVDRSGPVALDRAEAAWDTVATLPHPRLSVTSRGPTSRRDQGVDLAAIATYPAGAADYVRSLITGPHGALLTGAAIDQDRIRLGSATARGARELETLLGTEAGPPAGLTVSVVVAADASQLRDRGDDHDVDVRSMLDALVDTGLPEDALVVQGTTVTVGALAANSADDLAVAIERARAAEPDAARSIGIEIQIGDDMTVSLGTVGSPELVQLADQLRSRPGVAELRVKASDPSMGQRPKPPADTDASVVLTIRSTSLDDSVTSVATMVRGWAGPETSLSLHLVAVDPEGRRPSAHLRLDRERGAWVPSSLGRSTAESDRAAIAAWNAGAH